MLHGVSLAYLFCFEIRLLTQRLWLVGNECTDELGVRLIALAAIRITNLHCIR
jgi:hypothetical protein